MTFQAQACLMLLKALQMRELKQALEGPPWQDLIGDSVRQTTEVCGPRSTALLPGNSDSLLVAQSATA